MFSYFYFSISWFSLTSVNDIYKMLPVGNTVDYCNVGKCVWGLQDAEKMYKFTLSSVIYSKKM